MDLTAFLTILFVVLKASNTIDVSWWWILLPLCAPLIWLFLLLFMFVRKENNDSTKIRR